ncbi:MAG: hypothetical protein KF779_10745 [Hyphomonadaceae bacterium]|nr:hypothetical protein [Hyphomonadaceae bacterium]MCA8884999.1 hypothetical protein [Hyphomonadaceae bacterium]
MTTATMEMFNALSTDMDLQRKFAKDKKSVMRAFGLSRADAAAVASGGDSEIRKLLTGEQPLCFILGLTRSSKSE